MNNYVVIHGLDIRMFQQMVGVRLAAGWVCIGGITVVYDGKVLAYFQAMIGGE